MKKYSRWNRAEITQEMIDEAKKEFFARGGTITKIETEDSIDNGIGEYGDPNFFKLQQKDRIWNYAIEYIL